VLVARADAAPIDPLIAPSAGRLVLATDSFQVLQTSDTTVELTGQGADASLGHFRVQLGDGTVGTTPVAFWAEL
jgi:hypothetical protein